MKPNTARDLSAKKILHFLAFHLDLEFSSLLNCSSSMPGIQVFQSTLHAEGRVDLIIMNR